MRRVDYYFWIKSKAMLTKRNFQKHIRNLVFVHRKELLLSITIVIVIMGIIVLLLQYI